LDHALCGLGCISDSPDVAGVALAGVLVVLSPTRVTMARNDSVMDDVTYYVDRYPVLVCQALWGIWFNFTVV
jgi:hypothetical protein